MTLKDRRYLLDEFPKYYKDNIFEIPVRQAYYEAERIIMGYEQIKRRGCNCEYNRFQQQINKLYEQWNEKDKQVGLPNG